MKTGRELAFPIAYHNGEISCGLTKRELFAAMAMQGSIAAILTTKTDAESLGVLSVQAADALLAALEVSDE